MFQLLSLLSGLLLAIMIFINGRLTVQVGVFQATAIIHAVGAVFAFVVCLIRKEKPLPKSHSPWWFYLGGVVGVFTAVFNNFSFGKISLTSIVALNLLGQALFSIVIDMTGWFGMTRRPVSKSSGIGLLFCLAGIVMMLDQTVLDASLAVWFSLLTGISIVVSRSINARLAERIGALPGSFVNHIAGFPVTVLLAIWAAEKLPLIQFDNPWSFWIYTGGILGVGGVVLFNILVPKISQFSLTVLTFVGQIFTSFIIDLATGQTVDDASFTGALVISASIALNLLIEFYSSRKNKKSSAPN